MKVMFSFQKFSAWNDTVEVKVGSSITKSVENDKKIQLISLLRNFQAKWKVRFYPKAERFAGFSKNSFLAVIFFKQTSKAD